MKSFPINHDLHCHSYLSSCCEDVEMVPQRILQHAVDAQYSTVVLTDHLWDHDVPGASEWYAPQDIVHVQKALPLPQHEGVRFLFGCETEYCGGQKLGLSRAHFDLFDMVVIPVNHTHMKGFVRPDGYDTEEQMADLIPERLEELLQLDLPWRKIGIAHLNAGIMFREGDVNKILSLMDSNRLLRIFEALAERGAGIELNAGCFTHWRKNPEDVLKLFILAKQVGCTFYCASDAHDVEKLASVGKILPDVANALGLTENDVFMPQV